MKTKVVRGKHPFWIGLLAGLIAGIVATSVMLLLNTSFSGISLPEVVGSALTLLMPPSWFDYLHRTIGADAKHYLFYGILVGQCLVFALIGAVFQQRVTTQGQRFPWYQGLLLALILWLLTGIILLPLSRTFLIVEKGFDICGELIKKVEELSAWLLKRNKLWILSSESPPEYFTPESDLHTNQQKSKRNKPFPLL